MKRLFLLGGQDLEMQTIKQLLIDNGEQYYDNNLTWGAKLSDYANYLDFDGTIYGIELEEDITPSSNYVAIDHHGKNSYNKSSLEQIAELLNIKLSDKQKLIAANDSGYIKAMQMLCATKEQINDIRARDKKAQGITQEDEMLAQKSIGKSNNHFIFSLTPHFSAVSDIAYFKYRQYIIYNDSNIVFYGYNITQIKKILDSNGLTNIDYYYGGGDYGFIGVKDGVLNKNQINSLIKGIKEMKETIYSYHTFMLPFTFSNFNSNENWVKQPFEIKNQKDYNEFVYFYKHVQDVLFQKDDISKYYEYKNQIGTYVINCKKGNFELEIDKISLRIFNKNVAILSFKLKNTKYSDIDSILAINDFGRRIYPQFLGEQFTCNTKQAILANSITLTLENQEPITEDFCEFDKLEYYNNLQDIKLLPSFILKLIEPNFDNKKMIRPIIDDRMFVLSWYGNNAFSDALKNEQYAHNDKWYEYVFVDGDGITVHNKKMQENLIAQATYDRWMDYQYGCTLYGISKYSFVAITNESDFAKIVILPHMQTIYFQIFSLLLAYRATIINFADEIQEATDNDDVIAKKSQEVYKKYLTFLNKLFFKEVTAQDQGIELYNLAMGIMDIEKYMADLDKEINELHSYVNMIEEEKRTSAMNKISQLGSYLLLPSLLTGFLGVNIISFEDYRDLFSSNDTIFGVTLVCVVLSAFIMPIIQKIINKG